jgi:hypothetical protein
MAIRLQPHDYRAQSSTGISAAVTQISRSDANASFSNLAYWNLLSTVGTTWINSAAMEASVERLMTSWVTQLRFNVACGPAHTLNGLLIGNLRQELHGWDFRHSIERVAPHLAGTNSTEPG